MKISTRGRYGVRAMYDLATQYGEGPVPLKGIAERQGISEHYLEQLIAPLRKAGLVKSLRGVSGGYELARAPDRITVGDIIRVLEGPIAPVDCVNEDESQSATCEHPDGCITRRIWAKVRDSISEVLDSISLADLLVEVQRAPDGHIDCLTGSATGPAAAAAAEATHPHDHNGTNKRGPRRSAAGRRPAGRRSD